MNGAGSHKALGAADGIPSVAVRQPPEPVHWADSPWSVPRLRGRGEQRVIVMQRPHFVRAQLRSLLTPKSAVKRGASPTVSLAHHVASQASFSPHGSEPYIDAHARPRGRYRSDRLP